MVFVNNVVLIHQKAIALLSIVVRVGDCIWGIVFSQDSGLFYSDIVIL